VKAKKPASGTTIMGCRSVDNFHKLNKIEEGTYGVVYRARDKETGEIVALKKLKMDREREGFPMTSLREIKILMTFKHPHIVDVREVVVGNNLNHIFIVMEFVDHDLKTLMEEMRSPFAISEIKTLMQQLLEATAYLHDNWVIHRDLKTSNLLFNNHGMLKVADFGLAREYGSPLKPYTHNVVTLWYRAPELLLGQKKYTPAIDMWSIGCIFAELISKEPLLPGRSELDQIDRIFKLLGTANDSIWPGFSQLPNAKKVNFATQPYNNLRHKFPHISDHTFDLLNKLLTYDPEKRLSALEALKHPFFTERPPPKDPALMPTWPSVHEGGPRKKRRPSLDEEMQREREIAESKNEEERFMDARDRVYPSKPFVIKM